MAYVEELIRSEGDGSFSFGNPSLDKKSKVDGFSHGGDSYKVKTYDEITKLEKNGMFLYESVPGTCVNNMSIAADSVEFTVSGEEDAQITLGLEDGALYTVEVNGSSLGTMKTNMSGKLSLSVELNKGEEVPVKIVKSNG